ncbi:MAG: hypothetical protein ABJA78_12755 [Ferruginibacter sp.]
MKRLLVASAVTAFLFMSGCKSGGGDPKTVLMSFFSALSKKDISGAKKLATKESESMFSMIEMGMKMAGDKDMDKYDQTRMEFGESKIDGDKATVPVKDIKSGETTNFILKKESGDWKVAFDKATMMQMGTDKMQEKTSEGTDKMQEGTEKMQEGFDKLKNMNSDSLKDAMMKGMKALDSLKEALKNVH